MATIAPTRISKCLSNIQNTFRSTMVFTANSRKEKIFALIDRDGNTFEKIYWFEMPLPHI